MDLSDDICIINYIQLVVGLLFGTGGVIETSCPSNWVDFWKVLYFWGMARIGVSDLGILVVKYGICIQHLF